MEVYKLESVGFKYPNRDSRALENINTVFKKGEFVTICGKSGCGKTTLLRLLKPAISPYGEFTGKIIFRGENIKATDGKNLSSAVGFVMQSPENQIVTDKVWHELSFGLENMGVKTQQMRARVSEMVSFFGIQDWFYKKTTELSGGQKQILNLASVMVMRPEVLILDEPTSRLDPIAASEFLQMLKKINKELGTTVILAEHRLEEAFAISDRVIVMEKGGIIAEGTPHDVGRILKKNKNEMYDAMPTTVKVFEAVETEGVCPLTIEDAREWLLEYTKENKPVQFDTENNVSECQKPIIELKEVFFRYERASQDIIKNLNLTVFEGEILAILGGNGTGKTTALSLISGINNPQRGEIYIKGEKLSKIPNLYDGLMGVLPQEPKSLFAKKTVFSELMEMTDKKLAKQERERKVLEVSHLCRIDALLENHPYDLSGGEQQRAALAMILLKKPQILIMDEPTKGMDAHFKRIFAGILKDLKRGGATVIMVSHDLDFCAEFADRCALLFDGAVTSIGDKREFFLNNYFYTTRACRMARGIIENAVLEEDIINALGGRYEREIQEEIYEYKISEMPKDEEKEKISLRQIAKGVIFGLCFALAYMLKLMDIVSFKGEYYLLSGAEIVFLALCLKNLLPRKTIENNTAKPSKRGIGKRTRTASVLILLLIPLTIFFGIYYLGDRKYYFISLLIMLETILPFLIMFENRKAQAREIVIISVLCTLGVAGRTAFFMLPEFKPLIAIIIISGVCMGGETGFLVGAMSGFVSNFFFGQGPWTPWQMFALGIIGFIAGVMSEYGILTKNRYSLCMFGFLSALIVFGGIMNPASVLMVTANPTKEMIYSSFLVGFPVDLIHAMSTAFFLWVLGEPMIDKLERVKTKYGLMEFNKSA
ncbi:MAG: ATP-binding cassette domain-containing protein [Firmicutes bacterium]|nr:ATP-binding cassette domain-containing protein [Bacillota bacterium]